MDGLTHKLGRDTHERYGDHQQEDTRPGVHFRLCFFELLFLAQHLRGHIRPG